MEHIEPWKFDDLEEIQDMKRHYRELHAAYKDAVNTKDALVRLANRLPSY